MNKAAQINKSVQKTVPTKSVGRGRSQGLKVLLLAALIAVAAFLWSKPWREERALKAASFDQLREASKREPDNPRVFYHLGVRLRDLGQLGPARAAFQRAAQLDPNSEETLLALGTTAAAFGRIQEAYEALSKCAETHPKSANAHRTLALFLYENHALQKSYEEAIATTKCDPSDSKTWRLAGIAALQLQDLKGSEDALRRSVALDPKDWRSQSALGRTLDALHKPADALSCYREANRLAPEVGQTTLYLGQSLADAARTPAEIEAVRQTLAHAVEQNVGFPAQLALGQTLARQQNWKEAKTTLERAAESVPNSAAVHYELARVYRQLGDTAAAKRETARHDELKNYAEQKLSLGAQARTGKDSTARLQLARLYAAHKEYREALLEYRNLLAHAADKDASTAPATVLSAKQELAALEQVHPEAQSVREATDTAPTSSGPTTISTADLVRDAEAMLAKNRFSEAETSFTRIVYQDNTLGKAYEGLGIALLMQNKNEKAFHAFDTALKLDPKLPDAQYNLAHIYFVRGFVDEAARRLDTLTKQVPDNPEYLYALAACYLNDQPHYVQTEELLQKAISIGPVKSGYLRMLAKAQVNLNRNADAERSYRRALALDPDDSDTRVLLGTFLLVNQPSPLRQAEAEQLFKQTLIASPNNADALMGLGQIALSHGDSKEAVTRLETAVMHEANLSTAWYQLARAYDLVGDRKRAGAARKAFHDITSYRTNLSDTEEQARANPKEPGLRLKLAHLYAEGGQNALAINQYQVYMSLNSKDTTAHKELDALIKRLKATGKMPSMDALNSMLLASVKAK